MPKWEWPDARGYIGLGSWLLTVMVLVMIWTDRELLQSDAFLVLATAIIVSGWVGSIVSWAYGATKSGGELAERNSVQLEQQGSVPKQVEVVNPPSEPVPTAPVTEPAAEVKGEAPWDRQSESN